MMLDLLASLFAEFDRPDEFVGVMLVGSAARDQLLAYSDIDLIFFSSSEPTHDEQKYQLRYQDNQLISLSIKSIDSAHEELKDPIKAIDVVQGLRDGVILRDSRSKHISRLQEEAEQFFWTVDLQARANEAASYELMGNAEEVHKVLNGLANKDNASLLNGAWGLALAMPRVMALYKRVLSKGDSLFRSQVCEAVGIDSAWTRYHEIAIGTMPGVQPHSTLAQQAIGAIWLYKESVALCQPIMLIDHKHIAQTAVRIAESSGLVPTSP